MSYTFGDFVDPHAARSEGAPATLGRSGGVDPGRQPNVAHRRAATIHDRRRREEKVRGVVLTSPAGEIPNTVSGATTDYYMSNASGIAAVRQNSSNRHPVVVEAQSERSGLRYLADNVSHSADNLLVHAGAGGNRFSSDEGSGGETMGECFICYNVFDEDSSMMTPRNLQCGHAFCTGE